MKFSLVIVLLGLTAMVCARPLTDEEIIRDALIAFGDPNEPDEFPRRRNAISPFRNQFRNKGSSLRDRQNRQFFDVRENELIRDAFFAFGGSLF